MRIFLVDAFADAPFRGNAAAVCLPDRKLSDAWMQSLAQEMAQAETAFVQPLGDPFRLRWFTPSQEVDLCGHATLASAHILWEESLVPAETPIAFSTNSGNLVCSRNDGRIDMDFPLEAAEPTEGQAIAEALHEQPAWTGANRMDWLVELPSEHLLRSLTPDFQAIARLGRRGVIVTAQAENGADYDFVSRFFAPNAGVPEDSVTGSAHCALGPYWAAKLGNPSLTGFQASRRGGYVRVTVRDDHVVLSGHAVTTLRGEIE